MLDSKPSLRNQLSHQSTLNKSPTFEADELSNSEDETQIEVLSVNLDIAFLHSDALVVENEKTKRIDPLEWEKTLNPEDMFEEMISKLEEQEQKYEVLKSHLNHQTL